MTITDLMDDLAEKIRVTVEDYCAAAKSGGELQPIAVYAGYPPVRTKPDAAASFIYVLATDAHDREDGSIATVEIGFNIFDDDAADGWRSLFNLVEHVRQALLRDRCVKSRHSLVCSPGNDLMKMEVVVEQPWPQWQAKLEVAYAIAQPEEEEINIGHY